MQVEIWSDVVCPWCYIGKRQLELALASFPHRDHVVTTWRSYELDPTAPARRELGLSELVQRKYGLTAEQAEAANARITGIAEGLGLPYRLADAKPGSSFDAHRLVHLAGTHGRADAMKERFLAAYFTEGEPIGDRDTLVRLAVEVGLDETEVAGVLDGDAFASAVRDDERRAQELGVSGVPFFVVDGRYGISGAQPPDVLLGVLERAWADDPARGPAPGPAGEAAGAACADGACPA